MSSKNFDWDKIMKDAKLSDQKEYEKIKASNSPTQSAAQAYVNKSSSTNEKSFDEKMSDLKKENRQNRRNMFLAAVAQASNNQQDQAVTDNFTSAINKYKEGKNDINALKNSKWQESQNYNNEVIKNPDVEQLVKTAYEAKLSRDNNEKLSNQYSGTLAAFTDVGKAAMSGYSESQKMLEDAVNKLNEMGYDADSLIDTYSRQINKQDNEKLVQETEQLSNEHPFIANAAYVGANAFQVTALKETIETGLDNLINHKYAPVDTNSPAFAATNFRDTVSNTTAQNITNKIVEDTDSEKLATAGRFLYQTGLSMADFVSVAWMPQPMSLAIMGTSAAASSAKEATDRGLSAENAMATAIAAGLTEIMCEKFSIENFKALQATGNRGIKNFLTDTLKQSFTEGSEEVATEIINAMTDQFINGDMSALEQDYKNYIAQGMSEEEARRQVVTQFAKQVGESFMGGALSGGVMGAGASVVGNMAQSSRYRSAGNDIKSTGSAQELIDSGLQSNANTKSYKMAEQLQSKLDRDMYNNQTEEADYSNLSSKKLGQLQAVNDAQIVKENLINAVAGENNQEALVKAITNFTEGKGVSRADYRTIKGSEKLISAINSQYGTDFKSNNLSRIELSKLSGAVSRNPVSVAKIGADTEQQEIKPLRQGFNIQASDASGNNVVVNNISTNDGEMTILTNDGSRLNAKDIRFADSDYNDAFRLASDYPTEAAKSFISGFEQAENTDIIDYATGFKEIYQNTLTSKAVTNDEGSITDAIELGSRYNMTPQQSFLAYSAAVNTEIGYKSKKSSLSIKQQYDNAINSNATGLTLLGTPKTSMQKAEVELLKGFAEDKGLSVIVVDSVKSVLGEDSNAATVNGKIVLGLDTDNGMLLPYAGHELFHLLKNNNGSKNMAKELQSFIIDTLKSDAGYDYDTRFNELQESYNFKGTEAEITEQINEEIAGNACFTVLSQEENFTRLVKQNKSLAQRVKDFFADFVKKIRDRLVKLSKINPEYRALENNLKAQQKILDMFEKCLNSVQKNNTTVNDSAKFSIKEIIGKNGNYGIGVYLDTDFFDNIKRSQWDSEFVDYVYNNLAGTQIEIFDEDGVSEIIEFAKFNERVKKNGAKNKHKVIDKIARKKGVVSKLAIVHIDELISVAKDDGSNSEQSHQWLDENGWNFKTAYIETKNSKIYTANLNIANTKDGRKILYDINKITEIDDGDVASKGSHITSISVDSNISQKQTSVNTNDMQNNSKFSSKRDSDGNKLSQQQQEYFADSKVRDENGNLLVMYHGTPNANFTKFRSGSYFTQNEKYADRYQSPGASSLSVKTKMDNPDTYKVYLNIKKPFDTRNAAEREIFENEFYMKWGNGAPLSERGLPDWVEAMDLQEFIEENGYDYDGLIVDEGGEGGYGLPVYDRGLAYVTFNANQVKNTDNINPTDNEDIRFSLREPVEQKKDLVAVHNLSEEKMMKSLSLGGLPMPSIAIAKAKYGHTEFGKISLVFPASTIDPERKSNQVYSGDAYTPTYPQIEYKLSSKADELYDRALNLKGAALYNSVRYYPDNVLDRIQRIGKDEFLKKEIEDYGLKQLYLFEKTGETVPLQHKTNRSELDSETISKYDYIAEHMMEEILNEEGLNGREWNAKYYEKFKETINAYYKSLMPSLTEEELENIFNNEFPIRPKVLNTVSAVKRYIRHGAVTEETVSDEAATGEQIDKLVDKADYIKWFNNLYDGIIEKEGIRNNVDIYTNSGNRRSFEALHYEHNLENVIRAMKEQGKQGIGAFGKNIFGASKVNYNSISDIKDSSDKLINGSDAEAKALYEELRSNLSHRFYELASALPIHKDEFLATDSACEVLTEAVLKFKTKTGMDNYIKSELKGWANYSPSIVDDLIQIVDDIKNLPAAYFEAKPQRAVSFNEIYTAVIPDNSSDELIDRLDDNGIRYIKYEAGNDQNRIDIINSLDDVKFSRREQKDYDTLLKENAQLQQANELLKEELQLTKGHKLKPSSIKSVVNKLVDEHGAYHINKEELEDRLTGLFTYIANAGVNIDDSYIWTVANDIGRTIADGSSVKDTTFYNQYKDLKKRLRETAITVPPEVRKYVSAYANVNKIKVRNHGDISLDSFYTELTKDYPELFDPDIMAEEDQLARLIEVYESIVPIYTDRISQTGYSLDEYSSIVAAEIFEKYFDVKEVQTFADKKQKEIEQLKLHYNNTISDMRECYQKRYEQREKELKEKLKETRKEGNDRLIRQQAHFTEMSLNAFRRKRRTLIKNKIANVKKDLTRRLLNPTETAYVPRSLVQAIADVCDIINETEIKDQNGFERNQNIINALQNLHYNYEMLKNEEDVDYASEYEQEMGTKIAILKNTLEEITNANGGNSVQISQLDANYLSDIYHILRDIKNALVDATYQIGLEEKITNHERGIKLINEINATKGQKSTKVGRYELETLNPIRAVRKMTEYNEDAELFKMVNEINLGQRKADKFISDATKPFEMLRSNLKEFKRFSENLIETDIVDDKGNKVELTENEIVQLIMTMKRKQGKVHLMEGGFNLPDRKLMSKGRYKEALSKGIVVERVNPYVVNKMYSDLSDYAKTWISTSEYLFNTQGKDAINEVSMLLKHRKIASAENYIPLNVDTDFTNTEITALKFDNTIEGMGSLKSVAPKAKQPLVIAGLNTVVDRHISDVSKYYGLAIPIRNINKVITTQTSAYYDSQMKKSSVKTAIRDKWGDAGLKLIENLITDVQTTRKSNSSTLPDEVFSKIQSGFVQATLAGNISVTIKQAASYPTALANVSGKSLAAGLPVFSYSTSKFENLCNEIDEHTGIHFKRRIGLGIPEIGELKKNKSLLNKVQTATNNQKVNNAINVINPMKWIQSMDVRTTAALWVAAKEEVKSLYPDIKVNSEDYWDKVTELYEETIENTQPNYDVLHRPELQKTTNQLTRAVIMFKTQPLQNTGILYDSAFELKQMNREYKNNGSAENEIKLKKAKKKFKKAVVSQFSAALTFSAMSLLASAIKHTMYGYRDEDDDVTLSSVLKGVMDNMFNLMSTLLLPLGGGEIYEAVTSIGSKNSNDFISVPVVSTINDLWESISKTVETANGVISDEKTTVDLLKSIENLSYSVATVLGIPAKNLINYGKGIIANVKDIANGEFGKFESGVDRTNSQKVSLYGKYYLKNDEVKSSEIVREMIADKVAQGKTDEEARASVRDSFAAYYKPLYQEAVKKGDTKAKNDIISILTTTGVFVYKTKGRTLSVVIREWEEDAKKEE